MTTMGRMIRSAKMNEITPPKLIPPDHSTAASGTLPIEQTKLAAAITGPITGPHQRAAGCPARNRCDQNESGIQAAAAPAISSPMAMSRSTAAHSITKMWLTEVRPSLLARRRHRLRPPAMLMSIAAWPSIEPATARSACRRAASISRARTNSRKATATATIMIGPPTNSASVNCQEISRARMMPSSMTRLVLAISNAIAEVKLAPLRSSARASATAAYEQDDEAAPSPVATASERGPAPPISRVTVSRLTTAWTTADSVKPRISDQVTCQVIDPARASAWPIASSTDIALLRDRDAQQLAEAVLEQLVRKPVAETVEHHPAVLSEADQAGQPEHLQRVGHLVLGGGQGQRQVAHAQLAAARQGKQDPGPDRVGQHAEQPGQPPGLVGAEQPGAGRRDPLRVHRVLMIEGHRSASPHIRMNARTSG